MYYFAICTFLIAYFVNRNDINDIKGIINITTFNNVYY